MMKCSICNKELAQGNCPYLIEVFNEDDKKLGEKSILLCSYCKQYRLKDVQAYVDNMELKNNE